MLADALDRAVGSEIAAYALLVDAKDEPAAAFYRRHGFVPPQTMPLTLVLPLAPVKSLLQRAASGGSKYFRTDRLMKAEVQKPEQSPRSYDLHRRQTVTFGGSRMRSRFLALTTMAAALACGTGAGFAAPAQGGASTLSALSVMPLASVVVGASAVAEAVVAVPVAFSTAGAVLVIKSVELSARGTVYVLERASDGARASIEVAGKVAAGVSTAVGTTVTVGLISAGVVLTVAGQVIAFIPNEVGRALMHNERVTP